MINFIICDDNNAAGNALYCWIEKYIYNSGIEGKVLLCANQATKVIRFLENRDIATSDGDLNVFFLDINLNEEGINGITLAEKIKTEFDPTSKIIFITAYSHCISDAVNHCAEPFGYLIKPVKESVIEAYMHKIEKSYKIFRNSAQQSDVVSQETVQLKSKSKIYNIRLNDIIYIETICGKDGYIQITTALNEKITLKYSLYKLIEELNNIKNIFFQCYQSYAININYIYNIDKQKQKITLKDCKGNLSCVMLSRKKTVQDNLFNMLCKK